MRISQVHISQSQLTKVGLEIPNNCWSLNNAHAMSFIHDWTLFPLYNETPLFDPLVLLCLHYLYSRKVETLTKHIDKEGQHFKELVDCDKRTRRSAHLSHISPWVARNRR